MEELPLCSMCRKIEIQRRAVLQEQRQLNKNLRGIYIISKEELEIERRESYLRLKKYQEIKQRVRGAELETEYEAKLKELNSTHSDGITRKYEEIISVLQEAIRTRSKREVDPVEAYSVQEKVEKIRIELHKLRERKHQAEWDLKEEYCPSCDEEEERSEDVSDMELNIEGKLVKNA